MRKLSRPGRQTIDRITKTGWMDPIQMTSNGSYKKSAGVTRINTKITRVLATVVGERIMRSTLGSNLIFFLFRATNPLFDDQLRVAVLSPINRWMPELETVNFKVEREVDGHPKLTFLWKLKGTDSFEKYALPFDPATAQFKEVYYPAN